MKAVVAEADKASSQTLGLRQVNKAALIRLGVVFLLSGASSLLYQVAWQRLLTINYGVGPVSVTLIVSMYMLGLGLGALAGGALAQRYAGKSVLIYCLCEIILGLFGLASIPILHWLGNATSSASFAVYCLCICAFLCLPTIFNLLLAASVYFALPKSNRAYILHQANSQPKKSPKSQT
ncbi:MAG: hypothetical protein IPO31_26805 [Candidatus Obscuribacter sp.]|nr:hypothetical protein [Candidatus Obscuribacter sp.]